MLFSLFTGCRPADLVDGSKCKPAQQGHPDIKNGIDVDDNAKSPAGVDNSNDPDYDNLDP